MITGATRGIGAAIAADLEDAGADLILTGTPDGVVNCQPGDVVVTEIEGLGALQNTLIAAP